jgi:hypothetical protein
MISILSKLDVYLEARLLLLGFSATAPLTKQNNVTRHTVLIFEKYH